MKNECIKEELQSMVFVLNYMDSKIEKILKQLEDDLPEEAKKADTQDYQEPESRKEIAAPPTSDIEPGEKSKEFRRFAKNVADFAKAAGIKELTLKKWAWDHLKFLWNEKYNYIPDDDELLATTEVDLLNQVSQQIIVHHDQMGDFGRPF